MVKGQTTRIFGQIVLAVALPATVLIVLHRLGSLQWLRIDRTDPLGWLSASPVEEIVAATLRYLAIGLCYWLMLSTVAYLLAMRFAGPRIVSAVGRFTAPYIRRMAERAIAGSLAFSTILTPLTALPLEPDIPSVAPDYLPWNQASVPDEQITIRLDASLEVIVRPGDHLWALAERRMNEVLGRPASDPEIAPYWVKVVDANRESIRSGDPNLIFPGEVIVLPAVNDG